MSEDVLKPVNAVLMSGYVTQGKQVKKYETTLKEFLGNPYLLTLNSATAGLTLALRLLKNKDETFDWPGFDDTTDIVLTPALTCFATTAAVLSNNVKIRWLDVDLETANICLDDVKRKLNEHTKVIYLVHWGGMPVDLDALDKICDEHKVKYGFKPMVVEDCAHAFGAEFNGKKLSNHGNICVYSTQAIKHLTTGDGGIITFPHESLYNRCKLLRWYGIDREKRNYKGKDFRLENDILEWGYKFHMNDINATLGLYNLPHIARLLKKNRENGKYFDEHLKDVSGIKLLKNDQRFNSAYWLYTIRVLNGKKHEFMEKMKEAGIMTSQVHNRNDINSCVKDFQEPLPNLDILEKELVCIPVGWWLSNTDLEKVVRCICIALTKDTIGLSDYWRKINSVVIDFGGRKVNPDNNPLGNMIIFPKEKIIYIKYAKCGGTTILRNIIDRHYKGKYINQEKHIEFTKWINNITDNELLNEYFIYTIVRDPYSRSLSVINYIYKGDITSNEYCLKLHNEKNITWRNHFIPYNIICNNKYIFDYVGKMEDNYNESAHLLLRKLKININNIPKTNQTIKKIKTLSKECKEQINNYYEKDFQLFNYKSSS